MRLRHFVLFAVVAGLTGCTMDPAASRTAQTGASLGGSVHGGQQPVANARVYLLAASTAGYGSASVSLLNSGTAGSDSIGGYVLTASDGSFNITGDYTCTQGQQVYALALGGNPGAGTNNALGLVAAVGSCPAAGNLSTVPAIMISEPQTIAFAYAVSGFAVDALHVASSGTALAQTGLANAFAATANLLHGATTPAGNGTVPAAELNTLANIVASCVNTNGALTGPTSATPCYVLFHNAMAGSIVPADTASAAINIAHHPTANVGTLFNITSAAVPFAPTLSAAPADFTVAISYTGGGLATSTAETNQTASVVNNIAVDAAGNIWKPNYDGNSLTELSPLGAPLSPAAGYTGGGLNHPANVAIDLNGSAWTGNYGSNTVSRFSASGSPASGSPFGAGVVNQPANLAIDAGNNVWIAGSSTLAKLTNAGVNVSGSPFATNTLNGPYGIAIQPGGNVWVSNALANTTAVYTSAGAAASGSPYTQGVQRYPYGIAFDAATNGWIANQASVSKLSATGVNASGSPFASPSGTIPVSLALDGSGNVWVTDVSENVILELNNSGSYLSGTLGFQSSETSVPEGVAIDGSGNVWYSSYNDATIHELVGAASPVVTPLAYGVKNSLLGQRP